MNAAPNFSAAIVVPVFNHERAIADTVARLKPHGLPCYLVDDGSAAAGRAELDRLAAQEQAWLKLLRHEHNLGKGAAVRTGCEAAYTDGHTHAVQIDADGQHDVADLPAMVALARANPQAVISGVPVYDRSIPAVRYYGRWLTHVLVWLHTLSTEIRDSMCGFRVYPLAPSLELWRAGVIGTRMDFDTDILVRLHWAGHAVKHLPTRVTYPSDGVSHFRYWRDNLRMISLHVRLLFGMLWRSPKLVWRHLERQG